MLVKIKTESPTIDLIIDEAVGVNTEDGLTIEQWTTVVEVCAALGIPCSYISWGVDEEVRKVTPEFVGILSVKVSDRAGYLGIFQRHRQNDTLASFNKLLDRVNARFEREVSGKN
jgi:hypothetical protein